MISYLEGLNCTRITLVAACPSSMDPAIPERGTETTGEMTRLDKKSVKGTSDT